MKMYKVGSVHYVTQDDAKKAAKPLGLEFVPVDVPIKVRELADYLNDLIATAPAPVAATPTPRPDPVPTLNYSGKSLEIDDLWDTLPLSRRLHYAALAVEDARSRVPALKVEPAPSSAADLL